MMKRFFVFLLWGGLIVPSVCESQMHVGRASLKDTSLQHASFVGPTALEKVTADSLSVTGPFEFHILKVKKDTVIIGPTGNSEDGIFAALTITGSFTAKHILCAQLKATGPVEVTDLKVLGDTHIIGLLNATESSFQNMTLTADKIFLDNVTANNIVVEKNNSQKPQVLSLTGKTVIKGNITFEAGNGIVRSDSDVRIQGKVKGATIEKIKK